MKAAIFNPYLDTLGGGERYTLAVAQVLLDQGYLVDIEWHDPFIKEKLEKRFGLSLEGINVFPSIKRGDGYDLCFWVSDGSIPTLRARKNFLHFQVPFHNVGGKTLLNKMKLYRVNRVICNSNFTKSFIDQEFGVESLVIYPPVPVGKMTAKRKEKIILSVGRFSQLKQAKRQDVLVENFKKLYHLGLTDWRLILAGGSEVGSGDYLQRLRKLARGFPIEIVENPDFKTLLIMYSKAKFFWSAAGFGVKEFKEPEKVEHFGISVVEAMASGCVPVVFNAGGHKEIIKDRVNGYLWDKEASLTKITKQLINDTKNSRTLALQAQKDSVKFAYDVFEKALLKII